MKKILIIEDEKILAEMYKEKFDSAGFLTNFFLDCEEAKEFLEKEKPDLILLDILLPRSSGVDFLKWLKENKDYSNIPVMVLSNYDDLKTKKECFELGIKDYLIKTQYTPTEILEKIKNIIT